MFYHYLPTLNLVYKKDGRAVPEENIARGEQVFQHLPGRKWVELGNCGTTTTIGYRHRLRIQRHSSGAGGRLRIPPACPTIDLSTSRTLRYSEMSSKIFSCTSNLCYASWSKAWQYDGPAFNSVPGIFCSWIQRIACTQGQSFGSGLRFTGSKSRLF